MDSAENECRIFETFLKAFFLVFFLKFWQELLPMCSIGVPHQEANRVLLRERRLCDDHLLWEAQPSLVKMRIGFHDIMTCKWLSVVPSTLPQWLHMLSKFLVMVEALFPMKAFVPHFIVYCKFHLCANSCHEVGKSSFLKSNLYSLSQASVLHV